MKKPFGVLPDGRQATLYTIKNNTLTATLTDFGATLVSLWVPDRKGNKEDVVLGHDNVTAYVNDPTCMGATVGRNANRTAGAAFVLNGKTYHLTPNEHGCNNNHSLPDGYNQRLWQAESHTESSITFLLESPHLDQGFPGNATIRVTYALEAPAVLAITYEAISDRDTVMNLTHHSFFNLGGHQNPERAMAQELTLPARTFAFADGYNIPTGEMRAVADTPMDFRVPKPIGQDIEKDYESLRLQNGYDHAFEVFTSPCAILRDPVSGRTMAVETDCPCVQLYTGNYLDNEPGKGGVTYPVRSGICLETQFYPDAFHKPQWKKPVIQAGVPFRSRTKYKFN